MNNYSPQQRSRSPKKEVAFDIPISQQKLRLDPSSALLKRDEEDNFSIDKNKYIFPTVEDGLEGIKFIERSITSNSSDSSWVDF